MALWISGVPYTRFRAIRVRDAKVGFKSGAYQGTQATETLTTNRTWTFPNATGQILTTSSTDISTGSIVVTSDDNTYTQVHDFLYGTAVLTLPRVLAQSFASTGITITGAAIDDLVFVGICGTINGTLNLAGASVNATNVATVICQNISTESWGDTAKTANVSYLVIS